jgi:hypothetical protein
VAIVSDDLEIMDPTELRQQGRNYYDELAYSMRQRIINFVKAAPERPEQRWRPLETFIESAPDATVREIYARMMSVAEAAEVLMWKASLEAFIGGNPPPPKYESDRGARNPLQFLEAVWGEYLDHGVLYQDTLSAYDGKLIPAIYNYWNSRARQDNDRLPLPKRDRTEAILQRIVAHGPDAFEDVMRAVRAYARRGERDK